MEILIYTHDKTTFILDKYVKREIKKKLYAYECLYDFFKKEELESEYHYFLTSYGRKEMFSWRAKLYLRRKSKDATFDDTHTIETFNGNYILNGQEHKYLTKYKKNELIGIKRTEDTNLIHFYVVIKDQRIKPETVPLLTECCICYETNKNTLKNGFFECSHKELCMDCYNKLSQLKCPICRTI